MSGRRKRLHGIDAPEELTKTLPARRSAGLIFDMISDREIWQSARVMVKRFGDDAAREAEIRADALLVDDGAGGYAICRQIMQAMEGLSETEPGGNVN